MSEHVALLATDLVDSTSLAERLGDNRMLAVWDSHDRVARDLLRTWHGTEIKKSDGFLLQFATVSDAVNYACAYHRGLAGLSIPLKARAGVHVGPVTLRENRAEDIERGAKATELDGLAVPIATRTMSLAIGGQTLLTQEARDALCGTCVSVRSHGFWRMKGLEDPVELFEAGDCDAPFLPPPDSAKVYRVVREGANWLPLAKIPHSLPAERDPFIGRKDALPALAARLEAGVRLVSVIGIGGTGKTRLVQHFGWTWLGNFPGGVWFCDLSQARSLDGIVHAVAQGLDIPLGRADPVTQIGNALASRDRCLVVLDNFEQVASLAAPTLGKWLDRARGAQFVVTTRELLGIPGEERFSLEPLPAKDAAALFVERASAVKRDFLARDEDRTAIDNLVGLLDGLPLAIELAAARVRIMSPQMLLDRMSERFKVLASGKGRPKRQATLRSAFDWSWDLLSSPEQSALRQLTVCEGGFTLVAAEAILDLSACDAPPASLDALQSLVDKSLLRQIGSHRFGLLGTVKEYATARLRFDTDVAADALGELASAQKRHWRYFASLGESLAVADGCVEIENLIVACRRAAIAGDAAAAVGALARAWSALKLCGPFHSGVELARTVEAIDGLDTSQRATIDWIAGSALFELGSVAEARLRLESGLRLSRSAQDRHGESRLLCALGDQLTDEGNIDAAQRSLEQALSLARSVSDRGLECEALNRLGVMHDHCAHRVEARQYFEAALALARELEDKHLEGGLLGNLGSLLHNGGELIQAREYYEKALRLAEKVGDRRWEGNTRCNLALLHHDQGRSDEARLQFESALQLSQELGHMRLECTVLCNLGIVSEAQSRLEDARGCYERAVAVAHELADRRSEGQFRGYLGSLYGRLGRLGDAKQCLAIGEALLEDVSDSLSLGLLLCSKAGAENIGGDRVAALATLSRAEQMAEEIKAGPDSELRRALEKLRLSFAMNTGC